MEASELTEPTVDGALGVKAACHRSYLILDAELATGNGRWLDTDYGGNVFHT